MASRAKIRVASRLARQRRVRRQIRGTDERPRLCVFRSHRYTYAQIISDDTGRVLASASTKDMTSGEASRGSVDLAKELGARIAKLAIDKEVKSVVFDRNGYVFHGRVAAVAAGARENGLEF